MMILKTLVAMQDGLISLIAQVDAAPERSDWFGLTAAVIMIAGLLVASIRGSGRGHQD